MLIPMKKTAPKMVVFEMKLVLRLKICPIVPQPLKCSARNAHRIRITDQKLGPSRKSVLRIVWVSKYNAKQAVAFSVSDHVLSHSLVHDCGPRRQTAYCAGRFAFRSECLSARIDGYSNIQFFKGQIRFEKPQIKSRLSPVLRGGFQRNQAQSLQYFFSILCCLP